MLSGKRILVTGVVNADSIAFAVAERAQMQNAEVVLTTHERVRALTDDAARQLPKPPQLLTLDVTRPEDFDALETAVRRRWGGLDGALHAVAFAPQDALSGPFLDASQSSIELAFRTSVTSYSLLGRLLAELAPPRGASLVGLDFDAAGAWPVYNWMGVCKAALESSNRYLARDLARVGARANLVAAGPLLTRAASGIGDFQVLLDAWQTTSPLPWDPRDAGPVADAVCFLLSDYARAITGEILHVDAGYHAMASALRAAPVTA
jgi:enoyl-[acyl-carrier protein] reductase I